MDFPAHLVRTAKTAPTDFQAHPVRTVKMVPMGLPAAANPGETCECPPISPHWAGAVAPVFSHGIIE